jgi:O-antigen/teichoic acid export membrane protein
MINLGVNFVLPVIIITEYGSSLNGLVSNIRQLVIYLSIVEGGLAGAAVYSLYKPLANKEHSIVNGILSAANRFYSISGYIFTALILVSTFVYPLFLKDKTIEPLTISLLVLIIGVTGTLEFFVVGKYKVLLTADQRSYAISLIQSVSVLMNAIIIVILAKMHLNIILVQAFSLTSFFLRSYLYAFYCKKHYAFLNTASEPLTNPINKRWDVLFLNILGVVTMSTPTQVVTFMFGFIEMSVFSVYNLVFSGVLALLSTFSSGLSATFGDMIAKEQSDSFQKAYSQYEFLFYILLGVFYSCAAILVMPFMDIYTQNFSDANYIRPLLALSFAFSGLMYNLKTPQGMLVISAGLYRETRLATSIQALLNIIFSIALAFAFGVVGVILGQIVANTYRTIELAFFIPKNVTGLPMKQSLMRMGRTLLLFVICIGPPLYFLDLKATNYLEWLFLAIFVGFWCLAIYTLFNILFERKTAQQIYRRFRTLLKSK